MSALRLSHDDNPFVSILCLPLCFKIKKISVDRTNSMEQIPTREAVSSQLVMTFPQTNARNCNVSGSNVSRCLLRFLSSRLSVNLKEHLCLMWK